MGAGIPLFHTVPRADELERWEVFRNEHNITQQQNQISTWCNAQQLREWEQLSRILVDYGKHWNPASSDVSEHSTCGHVEAGTADARAAPLDPTYAGPIAALFARINAVPPYRRYRLDSRPAVVSGIQGAISAAVEERHPAKRKAPVCKSCGLPKLGHPRTGCPTGARPRVEQRPEVVPD